MRPKSLGRGGSISRPDMRRGSRLSAKVGGGVDDTYHSAASLDEVSFSLSPSRARASAHPRIQNLAHILSPPALACIVVFLPTAKARIRFVDARERERARERAERRTGSRKKKDLETSKRVRDFRKSLFRDLRDGRLPQKKANGSEPDQIEGGTISKYARQDNGRCK